LNEYINILIYSINLKATKWD